MFVFTFFEGGTFKMNTFKYFLVIICNKKIIIFWGGARNKAEPENFRWKSFTNIRWIWLWFLELDRGFHKPFRNTIDYYYSTSQTVFSGFALLEISVMMDCLSYY